MEVGKVSNHPFSNMLVTTSHINPNFEGSVKLEVPINNGLLDPIKHSAITFKDYLDLNIINWEGGSSLGESGEGDTGFKIRGLGSKGMSIRSGRNLNRTIKGHGGRFKVAGISRRNQKSPSSRDQEKNQSGTNRGKTKVMEYSLVSCGIGFIKGTSTIGLSD
ncbi:uncharacterized protein [Gossypium hirsutum]|uniref:Uncharacterized protein n=1 Tax=Gossypium hirsutum TaxID=3635 RepID=A0A1U8KNE7_GOSHI|nr:uncharacterized protein LOC107918949 [Gossypium hirsutum]